MYLPRRFVLVLLLATLLSPAHVDSAATAPPAQSLCFRHVAGGSECVDPELASFWQRNGGLAVFGYPLGRAIPEETPAGIRTVQHFERSRLEIHPEAAEPYTVQLGLLGGERLEQLGRAPGTPARPARGCRFFDHTGHNLCGSFLAYWQRHGLDLGDAGISERESLALLGTPLTEAAMETNAAGEQVLTQWFERARLEEPRGPANRQRVVQSGLNMEVQQALLPAPPPKGFVEIRGDKLFQEGKQVVLKGINYYPAVHPWAYMWLQWDGPSVAAELRRARREIGINSLRVLLPYRDVHGWSDSHGNVDRGMLDRLREFLQIAGDEDLKVILTLFDWHDGRSAAGSIEESYELGYLRTIVRAFKDDDRVLAWDLHNEPDNYYAWMDGFSTEVIDWLARMADEVRAIDRRHPITVGMAKQANLWIKGASGRSAADISDVISVHSYDAAQFGRAIEEVRARTGKPIILEEFGWPSGPDCTGPYYDEASQLYLYRKAMEVASEVAGVMAWWYQDPPTTIPFHYDENGHYGLYRRDASPKPALGTFRTLRVPALPSRTTSDLALTVAPPMPVPHWKPPLVFDGELTLHDSFKHFYVFFGAEATFGRPLTLAYRDERDKLVQYFERARFELNESEHVQPIDPEWAEGQTPEVYLDRVHLTPLGQQAIAGRTFDRVDDPGEAGVRYFPQTGHTLRGAFRELWETHGEIFYGPPLTESFDEVVDGSTVQVQYFTNFRFEQRDGNAAISPLGRDALNTRSCPRPY